MRVRQHRRFALTACPLRCMLIVALAAALTASPARSQPWLGFPPRCDCSPPPVIWIGPAPVCETIAVPIGTPTETHYAARLPSQNCNFAVRVTEEFANRIVTRRQSQQGPVRDFIMGADVFGNQTTETVITVDFVPSDAVARIHLNVDGEVDSTTVGVTPQAQVQSRGHHRFRLVKEIEFDGTQTRTRSPAVYVTPSLQNVGAVTGLSGMPLIGQMADGIALQQADARAPAAARITADRITKQAAPEFDRRIDAELHRLNQLLSGPARQRLEQFQFVPKSQALSTGDRDLLWCVTLDVPTAAPPLSVPSDSLSSGRAGGLYLHDSLINDLLARLPLGGLGVPDAAIDRWFRLLAEGGGLAALGRRGDPIEPQLATIVFDRLRPIQLHFENGQFQLVLRIGFTPVAGPAIPVQEITIPFSVELIPNAVHFHPCEVRIAPGDPTAVGGVIDEAARLVIREQVQRRLQSRSAPRRIPVELPDTPSSEVAIRNVTLEDGWLSITFD